MNVNNLSNTVCIYAWKGLHITPTGSVRMCCEQDDIDTNLTNNNKLQDIRTNKIWNKIRQNMLDGRKPEACNICWKKESQNLSSLRIRGNSYHNEHINRIISENDEQLKDNKLLQIDIRSTNLCNMKCYTCCPEFSSRWNLESIKNNNKFAITNNADSAGVITINNSNLEEYILDNITNIEEFYFAGGEPLLNPLHWKILEELDKHKRYNVGLIYNTNLLKLTYKDKNAIDIWEKFKDRVYVGVSVDAIDKRAEYVRYGTDWNVIHNNIKSLQNSNIKFQLDTCISNLNIAGLVELFDYVDRMKISSINLSNILQYPNYMHISQMPTSIKNNVVIKIKEYASSCKNKILKNIIINWIPVLESSFFEDKTNDLIPEFLNHIKELDKIRNTNLYDACPEWKVVL